MQWLYVVLVGALLWGAWFTGSLTDRRRLSLSQAQVAMWSSLVLALLIVVIVVRGSALRSTPGGWEGLLLVDVSSELLALLGISFGTGLLALNIKNDKVAKKKRGVPIRIVGPDRAKLAHWDPGKRYRGSFRDLWRAEEGEEKTDLTRLQNVVLTLTLGGAYLWMAISFIGQLGQVPIDPQTATVLPTLTPSMVALVGISHGGYLIAKIPDVASAAPRGEGGGEDVITSDGGGGDGT